MSRFASAFQSAAGTLMPPRLERHLPTMLVFEVKGFLADRSNPAAAELRALYATPQFHQLPMNTQDQITQLVYHRSMEASLAGEKSTTLGLLPFVSSRGFARLDEAGKRQALEVQSRLPAAARDDFRQLLSAQTVGGWLPPRLTHVVDQRATDGRSMLEHLASIASAPAAAAFDGDRVSRGDVLTGLMEEIRRPGSIDQSFKGTCTVTTMQYMLALEKPAELARLVAGLTSPDGRVKLAGGGTLERVPDSIEPDGTSRSASERLFQAALMDYGTGRAHYTNGSDETIKSGWLRWTRQQGLGLEESERALEGLFGRDFKATYDTSELSFDVDTLELRRTDLTDTLREKSPTWIALEWGSGGHAVLVTKVEGDRVFFRNPWGAQKHPNGGELENPPRRMEDNRIGLESMSVTDFHAHVKYALVD